MPCLGSGLTSEPCHSPLFACKSVFHFNGTLKLSLVHHALQREQSDLCKAFMLDRFILPNIFTRTISCFGGFLSVAVYSGQPQAEQEGSFRKSMIALPKAIMPPTAAHKHFCQWLWSRCWAAAWSRLMSGCSGEAIGFEYAVYMW